MSMKRMKIWDWAPRDWGKYDLCITFPLDPASYRLQGEAISVIKNLCKMLGRRYIYAFYAEDSTKIYVLVRTRLKLLRAKGHSEGWPLRLDEERCQVMAYTGNESEMIMSFAVPHRPEITFFPPFRYIYARYIADESVEQLYRRLPGMRHPFTKTVRLRMLQDFLQRDPAPEFRLFMDRMVQSGVALECFAIHDLRERAELSQHWFTWLPTTLPLELIREYFGEKIGFYFAFLDYLFHFAVFPAIVGVAFQVVAVLYDRYSRAEIPAFSFASVAFAIVCAQYWKRKQQLLATQWNSVGCDIQERLNANPRYQYTGRRITSCVDGREVVHFSFSQRLPYYFLSLCTLLFCIAVALCGQAAIYFARWQLYYTVVAPYAQWAAGGGSALQIVVFGRLFFALAVALTNLENHRSDFAYERALTVKVFLFQTVNALSPFYYLAFIARYINKHEQTETSLGECGFDNCMQPLAINMAAVAGCLALQRLLWHYLPPWLTFRVLASCCGKYRAQYYNTAMQPIVTTDSSLPPPRNDTDTDAAPAEDEKEREESGGDACVGVGEDLEAGEQHVTYDHVHPPNDDFDDDDDLPEPEESRSLATYLQRKQSSFYLKERGYDHEFRRQGLSVPPPASPEISQRRGLYGVGPSPSNAEHEEAPREEAEEDEEVDYLENPFSFMRSTMDVNKELVRNYSHLFVMLALVLCFGCVLPAVYLLLAVYLFLEIRGQGWQFANLYPRSLPLTAESIGLWMTLLDVLLIVANLTNASLIILTMSQFQKWSLEHRLLLWIGIVGSLSLLQFGLHVFLSIVPEETIIQRQRTQFITRKLIEKLPDKEDSLPIEML